MATIQSLRKQAEKRALEQAEREKGIKDTYIQGLILEQELRIIDHILINELEFIRADGTIIEYVDPDTLVRKDG